jgi:hypothetical protein
MLTATNADTRSAWLIPSLVVAATITCALAGLAIAQEVSIKVLVNDDPISDYDIAQRERFLAITTQTQPSPELKKKATDSIIDEHLQIQAGRTLGITPDEEDVTKILSDMASKNNLDVAGLTTAGPHSRSDRLAGRRPAQVPPPSERWRRRRGSRTPGIRRGRRNAIYSADSPN